VARSKKDAREIEVTGPDGKPKKEEGLDVLGRTIGHLLERIPEFDKALDHYAGDLMKATPAQRKLLDEAGAAWGRYGGDYQVIAQQYTDGDAVTKAQIKKLVPEVEQIVAAQNMRQQIAGEKGKDQPVGAYITITARYMPAWKKMKAGDIDGAIATIVGVMNADQKYHLQGLPVMAKIYEIRGDVPAAIKTQLQIAIDNEKTSSQDLGLHFLAKLYEAGEAKALKENNPKKAEAYRKQAYDTWYRSRERDALDFYALRNTRNYEAKYNYTAPADIVKAIKDSRKGGVPNAAPKAPPTFQSY